MYYYRMMNGDDGSFGIIMMLTGTLFIVGVIILVVWLLNRNKPEIINRTMPLDIAKERYAKGELTKQEFEQLKKDLISH